MPEIRHDLTRTVLAILCIVGLIAASFSVVRPFLGALVWAATLVIATWPLMLRLQAALGGRRGLAVTLMTVALLLIVVLPLSAAIGAIVVNSDRIMALILAVPDFHVPDGASMAGGHSAGGRKRPSSSGRRSPATTPPRSRGWRHPMSARSPAGSSGQSAARVAWSFICS